MNIAITSVVPDVLCDNIHGVGMLRLLIVSEGMCFIVASATDVATYYTDPEILGGTAVFTGVLCIAFETVLCHERIILCVTTDWTARSTPLLQARTVKDVLTEDCEKACGLIHALKTDGAGRKLDQGRCRWCK